MNRRKKPDNLIYWITILFLCVLVGIIFFLAGCVSMPRYRRDVLANYKKGMKIGQQPLNDLMNPSSLNKDK